MTTTTLSAPTPSFNTGDGVTARVASTATHANVHRTVTLLPEAPWPSFRAIARSSTRHRRYKMRANPARAKLTEARHRQRMGSAVTILAWVESVFQGVGVPGSTLGLG